MFPVLNVWYGVMSLCSGSVVFWIIWIIRSYNPNIALNNVNDIHLTCIHVLIFNFLCVPYLKHVFWIIWSHDLYCKYSDSRKFWYCCLFEKMLTQLNPYNYDGTSHIVNVTINHAVKADINIYQSIWSRMRTSDKWQSRKLVTIYYFSFVCNPIWWVRSSFALFFSHSDIFCLRSRWSRWSRTLLSTMT